MADNGASEPIVAGSFADKVRSEIDAYLRDPLLFPEEFVTWVPQRVELVGITVPARSVTGAYTTADDISGLGDPAHGRPVMIRANGAPYDFMQLTFDDVYGKWVSSFVWIFRLDTVSILNTSDVWTLDSVAAGNRMHMPGFVEFYAAGLLPQTQVSVYVNGGGNGTAVRPVFMEFDTGDSSTTTFGTGAELSIPATGYHSFGSWEDTTFSGPPAATVVWCGLQYKKNAAGTLNALNATVTVRWVADRV